MQLIRRLAQRKEADQPDDKEAKARDLEKRSEIADRRWKILERRVRFRSSIPN